MLENQSINIPYEYVCPISREMVIDPVVTADGHSYEKSAIRRWILPGQMKSPPTGLILKNDILTPNHC